MRLLNLLLPLCVTGSEALQLQPIAEQVLAKVYGVAVKGRTANGTLPVPTAFPEWVPGAGTEYVSKDVTDWTAGFFGGTLWQLYRLSRVAELPVSSATLESLARHWTAPLASQKDRTDTHDLGFMVHDSVGWEAVLYADATAQQVVVDAAVALSARFNPVTKTIRSWGALDEPARFEVIIDNMMNLEMLYYAAHISRNATLYDIATTHSQATHENHFRPDGGSYHVVDYNQTDGSVTAKYTHQGYANSSTWSRGQAWAAYGFVIAYKWTRDPVFLDRAKNATDYFLAHLPADGVPYWDFDAPLPGPRDTSAAMVLASGMLFLVEMDPASKRKYLAPAIKLIEDTLALSQSDSATFTTNPYSVTKIGFESILRNGTIDNNPAHTHTERSADTGIVYQGYYLVEALVRLVKMGVLKS